MKYKRIILILSIFILFSIASVSASEVDDNVMMSDENLEIESTSIEHDLKTTEDNQVLGKSNNDEIQILKDDDPNATATFSDLKNEINGGGNITLKYKIYNYDGAGEGPEPVTINVANIVIDGNGAVIDMTNSNTQVFQIWSDNVTIKNLTIKNAFREESAGVTGLAFYVVGNYAKILDCNFIDNHGHGLGAVYFEDNTNGVVTNCNFINNDALSYGQGGAIYFETYGRVTNCYFSDNSAGEGDDIYSEDSSVTADTCIFKGTNTNVNVQIVPPTLNVSDITTLYDSGEKITLDLKTNSSMPVDNGNISISVYDKNNSSLVREYSCLSGEGWDMDLPVGSYYAIFNTEYAGFEAINRTVTVIPNTEYYINVTPVTTSNKTVTLSAKSNIPTDLIGGKLMFILPNGDEINATYDSNGTWWAVHTFDDYGTYEINATYTNFKMATVKSATITVEKTKSTIDLDDIVLDYPESELVTVTTEGATGITAKIDDDPISVVNNYTIPISGLDAGNYTLTVTTIPDETHVSVSKTVNLTVNKASVKIAANDLELKFEDKFKLVYVLVPENAQGQIYFASDDPYVANVSSSGKITALSAGTANITITFSGNKNYEETSKTIKVKVNKADSTLSIASAALNYGNSLNITADTTGAKGITAKINGSDVKVDGFTIEIPVLDAGKYTLTVATIPDENHNPVTKTSSITVNKASTEITVETASLDLFVGDETVIVAHLSPADAGNVTFTSSNESVVEVDAQGNVIAQGKGQAIITLSFAGNNKYAAAKNRTVTVTVSLDDASVTVDNNTLDLKIGETYAINATKHPDTILLDITYTSSNNSVVTVDEKGIATAVSEGTAIITVEVGDGEIYAKNSTTVNVTVSKIPTEIGANDLELTFGDKSKVVYTLTPENAEGNISFVSSNPDVVNVSSSGKITALSAGTANITITFSGNKNYEKSTKTIKVKVDKADSTLIIESTELDYGNSINITADTTGAKGITAKINGSDVKIDGFTIEIPILDAGTYILSVTTIADDNHNPVTETAKITVNKLDTKLNATYDANSKNIVATVKDADGNPVSGLNVSFAIDGGKNVTTDADGQAKYSTADLADGTYNVTVQAHGNEIYKDSNKQTVKFTVANKKKSKIFLRNALYFVTQTKMVQVTLWDENNQPLANKTVYIKAYDSVWHGITDENGDAYIRVGIGFGVHNATVGFDGDDQYNASTKAGYIRVIKQTPSVMVRGSDSQFKVNDDNKIVKVHLRDRDDKPLPEGSKIAFKINGKTYVGTTDINGVASIKISISTVGTFTAQAIYAGNSAYNAVTRDIKIRIV